MSTPLIVSLVEERDLVILPCCETEGAIWGRSVNGYEWAECRACGEEYPGLIATENEQRKLWNKIDKRTKKQDAAKAA